MTVKDIAEKLNLRVFSASNSLDKEIKGGYTSDLLSDVMGHAQEDEVWITLQTHKNVMAIASLKDLSAVILVKGLQPEDDTLAQSNEEGIPILGTDDETFEISGKLFALLKNN